MTDDDDELTQLLLSVDPEDLPDLVNALPLAAVEKLLHRTEPPRDLVADPLRLATDIDPRIRTRPHLTYLAGRLGNAIRDVENGHNRFLFVSMPPRSGKSTLTSLYLPVWVLARHPTWKVGLVSHDSDFAVSWGRRVRSLIEQHPGLGVRLAADVTASGEWETSERGGVLARGIGGSVVGRGFNVLLLDDVVKGFTDAHSVKVRNSVWDRWRSDLFTRLEPPYLVVVSMTRWHDDDFAGRLLSDEFEGNPDDWETIVFPAVAEDDDVLGRAPGQPLYSPILDETEDEALARWADVKEMVGPYVWSALYQGRPQPARGAIFDVSWFRYWTTNESRLRADNPLIRYIDPLTLSGGHWLDSWDCAFKASQSTDWVVAQRWVRHGPDRYLVAQQRGRWSFTATLAKMRMWADNTPPWLSPGGRYVHERLVEDAANGPALIDVMKENVSGFRGVRAVASKEARARLVTPECASGHVWLPHPDEPGNEWVHDLLSELRSFPHDVHDDQVDSLTQALAGLRDPGRGQVTVPGRVAGNRMVRRAVPTGVRRWPR